MENHINMYFKKYYKFPLKSNIIGAITNDYKKAFDWCCNLSESNKENIINCINGNSKSNHFGWSYNEGFIYFKEEKIILIRGWGMLTGKGGYNLSSEEAIKIQDDFGNHIVQMLNK